MKVDYQNGHYLFSYTLPTNEDKKGNTLQKLDWQLSTKDQVRFTSTKNLKGAGRETKEFNLTTYFDELVERNKLDKSDFVGSLLVLSEAQPFKDFMFGRNLLLQIRNSEKGDDGGILQCPSCGFDSRKDFQGKHYNGDANGAYNIARKGMVILEKIVKEEKSLGITNVEWDNFATSRRYLY